MCLENNHLSFLERDVRRRDWRCCRLEVVLEQIGQGETQCRQPTRVFVTPCDTSGTVTGPQVAFFLHQSTSLQQLEQWFRTYDPDLVLSLRGNTEGFPHLMRYVEAKHTALCLGRNQTPLRQIGQTRILSSYGQCCEATSVPTRRAYSYRSVVKFHVSRRGSMDCTNLRVFPQHESAMHQGNLRFGHQCDTISSSDGRWCACSVEKDAP